MPDEERTEVLKGLSPGQQKALNYDWHFIARPNQLQPAGDWQFWLLLAGRGFGKTKTGGETVREWAAEPLPAPIHIVAPTTADIRDVMIEGPAGILSAYAPGEAPEYQPSKRHKLTWPNGNIALGFSADEPQRLRGPQCCRFWADELCAWRFAQDAWDNLMMGFRIGSDLRGVITTTPKPTRLLREIISDPGTHVTRATTYDNRANLAPKFFERIIRKYEGTRLGRQELLAEVLDDIPGALWTRAMIDRARIKLVDVRWDLITRIVVAIDPAVTKGEESNETGIVVAGLTRSLHVVVLDDGSCKETPGGWAKIAINLFKQWKADRIIGEVNNGGDLVAANMAAVGQGMNPPMFVPFRAVRASRGKKKRFEPVGALYEQARVHHVGFFPELETQMCEWTPLATEEGKDDDQEDDRIDALAWAIHELLIDQEQQSEKVLFGEGSQYRISAV